MALNKNEVKLIQDMIETLIYYRFKNLEKETYINAEIGIKALNSSINRKQAETVGTVSGWGKTIIDIHSSRTKLENFNCGSLTELDLILKANQFVRKSSGLIKDTYIYGCDYIIVGNGDTSLGEPQIITSFESAYDCYGEVNERNNLMEKFIKVINDGNNFTSGVFYYGSEMIFFDIEDNIDFNTVTQNYKINEVSREEHGFAYIPVVKVTNSPRVSDSSGESLISKSVMYAIDAINRTFGNAEWNSEYYAHPKRYLAGVDLSKYQNTDGTANTQAVSALMKDIVVISKEVDEDGKSTTPITGQLPTGSPEPYISLRDAFAQEIVRELFIPEYYLNAGKGMPTAVEAMIASEHPFNLSIDEKKEGFEYAFLEVMKIICLSIYGNIPEEFYNIEVEWKDTVTTSIASRVDALIKLISSGVIPSNSPIIRTFIPWTGSQKRLLIKYQESGEASNNSLADSIRSLGSQLISSNSTEAIVNSVNTVTE